MVKSTDLRDSLFIIILLLCLCNKHSQAQDCFNIDPVDQVVEGGNLFTGYIDDDGIVTINTPGFNEYQHEIMFVTDGFDPIAMECGIEIPVVPPGSLTSLRLGDAATGAQAASIEIPFTVTVDNAYLLISYAVILDDPGHEPYEQPRFEVTAFDDSGQILSECTEYAVRAAASIPGFQNCDTWRVRDWTSNGISLQDYIGQNITLVFRTTDCSKGGHAGYAYVTATCQPLKINVQGFCPDSTSAHLSIAAGFETYQWSTGDTGQSITVDNPSVGDMFSVTVTTVNDCVVEVATILEDFPAEQILTVNPFPDLTICKGEVAEISLTGEDIGLITWDHLPYSIPTLFEAPLETTTYSYSVANSAGCLEESGDITVTVIQPLAPEFSSTDVDVCMGDSITLSIDNPDLVGDISWGGTGFQNVTSITLLPMQSQEILVQYDDTFGCGPFELSYYLEVIQEEDFNLTIDLDANDVNKICEGEPIELSIPSQSNIESVNWTADNGFTASGQSISLNPTSTATYTAEIESSQGCLYQSQTTVDVLVPPTISYTVSPDATLCKNKFMELAVEGENIGDVYWKELNLYAQSVVVEGINDITYNVEINDLLDCQTYTEAIKITVPQTDFNYTKSDDALVCPGVPHVLSVTGNDIGEVRWISRNQSLASIEVTPRDEFTVYPFYVTDTYGCDTIYDEIQVQQYIPDCKIRFPSAFSPNGDNMNDKFGPLFPCIDPYIESYEFTVYDRWGDEVFRTQDMQQAWGGYPDASMNHLGVFLWHAEVRNSICEEPEIFKGNVMMIQ